MAVIRYSNFDLTVQTIAERNAISKKVNGMTVVVLDAIADPAAGAGKAIYRWDSSDNTWILIISGTYGSISFITEEINIVDGVAQLSNYPTDNQLWGIYVMDGDTIMYELRLSDLNVNLNTVSNLDSYNGLTLKVTYAHGTLVQQINAVLDTRIGIFKQNTIPINPNIGDFWLNTDNGVLTQYRYLDFTNNVKDWVEV